MNDDQKTDDEIKRGRNATALIENPVFVEAFTKVRNGLVDSLERSAVGDKDAQHEIALCLQLLKRVHGHIAEVAQTGRLALLQKQERESWLKRTMRKVA